MFDHNPADNATDSCNHRKWTITNNVKDNETVVTCDCCGDVLEVVSPMLPKDLP